MNVRRVITLLIFSLVVPLIPTAVWSFEELTDRELTAITAGNVEPSLENMAAMTRIPFRYTGNKGEVSGEVFVIPMTEIRNQGTLQLMDSAQANLRSLINVNAVNSPVQILLNLNININSTIGNLNQLNQLLVDQGL